MNKKLLFAAMSLAALTACTDNDFESQKVAQQEATPVTFEVINNNDAFTRASMNGNKVAWSATDGDLFTLYHGAAALGDVTGYQNATYTAAAAEGSPAVLTTPSMILKGAAIMVWPADTAFNIGSGDDLTITVPQEQPADIENYIPYVSEQIEIGTYDPVKALPNTAGYQREYPIYMRPMASQLNLKTDYAGTDATIAQLYEGGSACPADGGIEPISLTSVGLVANEGNKVLTIEVPVKFSDPGTGAGSIKQQWNDAVKNNAWGKITDFDKTNIAATGQVEQLTTKCIQGLDGCKLLILPLKADLAGTEKAGVIVNTIYGKVIVAASTFTGSKYSDDEIKDAWYRYVSATGATIAGETKAATAGSDGKFKTTANIAVGMEQTLNGFSGYTATSGIVKSEPIGAAATRYVKVILDYLDMSDLHIQNDKHLRDAILVWNHIKAGNVTVYLDGDDDKEFEMSQSTIALINEINAAAAKEDTPRSFQVMPCTLAGEKCETIVITGGGDIQDMPFIVKNGTEQADVAFNAGETWNWKGTDTSAAPTAIKTIKVGEGVKSIINKGTMTNAATATLAIYDAAAAQILTVPFTNEGTWNITAGTLNVQFNVTNIGTVNISAGAQYRQDGNAGATIFTNEAKTLPQRFLPANKTAEIGVVNNSGVFATVGTGTNIGTINNYGLIEHAAGAKTYITSNQQGTSPKFAEAFNAEVGSENKLGQINLMWDNKDDNNVAISNAHQDGFVSVTITAANAPTNKTLTATSVAAFVNYVIVEGGIEKVTGTPTATKPIFVELNQPGTEVIWGASGTDPYAGMILLSDINIQRAVAVKSSVTYLAADIYLGGSFTCTDYNGYYGDTSAKEATNIITW